MKKVNKIERREARREEFIEEILDAAAPFSLNCQKWQTAALEDSVNNLNNKVLRHEIEQKLVCLGHTDEVDEKVFDELQFNKNAYLNDRNGRVISAFGCSYGQTFTFFDLENLINVMLIYYVDIEA